MLIAASMPPGVEHLSTGDMLDMWPWLIAASMPPGVEHMNMHPGA